MTSAHRSPESAHRSGDSELKTEVFIVKTPEDQDAVIVSFVDGDDVNGIYLYEPGADPVELHGVTMNGAANEFEHATVTTHQAVPCHRNTDVEVLDTDYPGDGMVTRAERDAAVERATEDHANLQQAYDTLRERAEKLTDAAESTHRASHPGAYGWCQAVVCLEAHRLAAEL